VEYRYSVSFLTERSSRRWNAPGPGIEDKAFDAGETVLAMPGLQRAQPSALLQHHRQDRPGLLVGHQAADGSARPPEIASHIDARRSTLHQQAPCKQIEKHQTTAYTAIIIGNGKALRSGVWSTPDLSDAPP